jgi:CII-binding regulator of phage lambda lysogenization HflD
VKQYFQDPKVMWDVYEEETAALKAGLEQVWADLTKKSNADAASRNIASSWKLHGN